MKAFGGLDLHRTGSYMFITTEVEVPSFDAKSILESMRTGNFRTGSPVFNINSRAEIGAGYFLFIFVLRKFLNLVRWCRDLVGI